MYVCFNNKSAENGILYLEQSIVKYIKFYTVLIFRCNFIFLLNAFKYI